MFGEQQVDSDTFGAIFHVLPGLPCDVIFGHDLLDHTDAFILCPNTSTAHPRTDDTWFVQKVSISLGPVSINFPFPRKRRHSRLDIPNPKEIHDDDRHAEMFRRTRSEEETVLLEARYRDTARAMKRRKAREWDVLHTNCITAMLYEVERHSLAVRSASLHETAASTFIDIFHIRNQFTWLRFNAEILFSENSIVNATKLSMSLEI